MIRTLALAALLLAPALAGCTVNPATGGPSFTGFMGPEEESRIGREQHPQVVRAFGGVYPDRRIQDYMTRVGQSLVRVTELPDLRFTFTVLDSPVINAFALPGGYVYVTRGLMALASDEAEIAGVLAHEIGHVTARHSAQRHSQQVVAGLGAAVVGAITGSEEFADSFSFGASAVLQSYSRDQEFEADTLAVRYLGRVGYALDAMAGFLGKLDRQSRFEAELAGRAPGEVDGLNIMSTHPRTLDRVQRAASTGGPGQGRRERDAYLQAIDGLVYGDDPEHGFVSGQAFIHPRLGIRFEVPPGFRLVNGARQVIAQNPNGATIAFDSAQVEPIATADYLRRVWGRSLPLGEVEQTQVNGFETATGAVRIQARRGPLDLRLVAIRMDQAIHRFLYLTPPALTQPLETDLRRATYSFRRLTSAEAAAARPQRIRLHAVRPGDTRAGLIDFMPPEAGRGRRFDIMNGLADGAIPPVGTVVKVIAE
ncbi:MAG: peptidase M48 [Alphaproteobacteria bacterium]|nr:peptidase M48 [Alphaproteobacteria bacterium]